jgi:hypothetical protein
VLPVDAQLAGLRQRQHVGAGIADRAEQAAVFGREWIRRQPLGEILIACRRSSGEMLITRRSSPSGGATSTMTWLTRSAVVGGNPFRAIRPPIRCRQHRLERS